MERKRKANKAFFFLFAFCCFFFLSLKSAAEVNYDESDIVNLAGDVYSESTSMSSNNNDNKGNSDSNDSNLEWAAPRRRLRVRKKIDNEGLSDVLVGSMVEGVAKEITGGLIRNTIDDVYKSVGDAVSTAVKKTSTTVSNKLTWGDLVPLFENWATKLMTKIFNEDIRKEDVFKGDFVESCKDTWEKSPIVPEKNGETILKACLLNYQAKFKQKYPNYDPAIHQRYSSLLQEENLATWIPEDFVDEGEDKTDEKGTDEENEAHEEKEIDNEHETKEKE